MSLLLLPRLGVGNVVAFNNNFVVTKDGNPWSDGGGDTFDSTVGVQIGAGNGWLRVADGAYTAADGVIQSSEVIAAGAVDVGVYAGWATAGIFACEVELGFQPTQPLQPLNLRFACNTGYDNGSPTGIVTRSFAIGSNSYELKSVWTTYGGQDSWNTTGETQITVTVVPFLAAQNAAGANPFNWSGAGDDRDYRFDAIERGATVYVQWGRVNVDAVQDWIIGDLVESMEYASCPHARIALSSTAPGAHCPGLARLSSPQSDRWAQAGGHARRFRGIAGLRRDIHFGGNGRIVGTVKAKGLPDQPLVRQVLLYSENTNMLVAAAWSDADGQYRFEQIDPAQRYRVIAADYQQVYRAVIADRLTPEPMP